MPGVVGIEGGDVFELLPATAVVSGDTVVIPNFDTLIHWERGFPLRTGCLLTCAADHHLLPGILTLLIREFERLHRLQHQRPWAWHELTNGALDVLILTSTPS